VTFVAQHSQLKRRASLLIRCLDCDGAPLVAAVAWVNGRPMTEAKEQAEGIAPEGRIRRHWVLGWADRGTELNARIGTHRHVVPLEDVRAQLPPPGAPRAEMKIRHTSPS
jgi:hypothetical protein